VYAPEYNITSQVIKNALPSFLDASKRQKIYENLFKNLKLDSSLYHLPPDMHTDALELVHSKRYIFNLQHYSKTVRSAFENLSTFQSLEHNDLYMGLVKPMLKATSGTIYALDLALQYGWSINLSGGFHHAEATKGAGFCFFADLAIAAKLALLRLSANQKILIVDLDAHQGNGTALTLFNEPNVVLIDFYNSINKPYSEKASQRINYNFKLDPLISDREYLALLNQTLNYVMSQHNFGLIIFNAGADIVANDKIGKMNISDEALLERDRLVFQQAFNHNIPILATLSGAYRSDASQLIAESFYRIIKETTYYKGLKSEIIS
jgi:histone deacetylase 11